MTFTVLETPAAQAAFLFVAERLGLPSYNDKRAQHRRYKWYVSSWKEAQDVQTAAKLRGFEVEANPPCKYAMMRLSTIVLRTTHDFKTPKIPPEIKLKGEEKDPLGFTKGELLREWHPSDMKTKVKNVRVVADGVTFQFAALPGRTFKIAVSEV